MQNFFVFLVMSITIIHIIKADCNSNNTSAFDCKNKGSPHFYRDSSGACRFGCKNGNKILSCEELNPPPNKPEYKNAHCQEKAFNCEDRGRPKWIEYDDQCNFSCLVGGDILTSCDRLHFHKY